MLAVLASDYFGLTEFSNALSFFYISYYIFPVLLFFGNFIIYRDKAVWVRFIIAASVTLLFVLFGPIMILLYAKLAMELGMKI